MLKYENAWAKKIAIIGDRTFLALQGQTEPLNGDCLETIAFQVSHFAYSLGCGFGCDSKTVEYLALLYCLSEVTGGELLFRLVNDAICPEKEKITPGDILYFRIHALSPHSIGSSGAVDADGIAVLKEVLTGEWTMPESLAIILARKLNNVIKAMTRTEYLREGGITNTRNIEIIKMIIEEERHIIERYSRGEKCLLPPEYEEMLKDPPYPENFFAEDEKTAILAEVRHYNEGKTEKNDLVRYLAFLEVSYKDPRNRFL